MTVKSREALKRLENVIGAWKIWRNNSERERKYAELIYYEAKEFVKSYEERDSKGDLTWERPTPPC